MKPNRIKELHQTDANEQHNITERRGGGRQTKQKAEVSEDGSFISTSRTREHNNQTQGAHPPRSPSNPFSFPTRHWGTLHVWYRWTTASLWEASGCSFEPKPLHRRRRSVTRRPYVASREWGCVALVGRSFHLQMCLFCRSTENIKAEGQKAHWLDLTSTCQVSSSTISWELAGTGQRWSSLKTCSQNIFSFQVVFWDAGMQQQVLSDDGWTFWNIWKTEGSLSAGELRGWMSAGNMETGF